MNRLVFRSFPVAMVIGLLLQVTSSLYAQRTSLYTDPQGTQQRYQTAQPMQPANAMRASAQMPLINPSEIDPNGQVIAGLPGYAQAPQNGPASAEFAAASWIYTPTPSPRVLRRHDLVNIRVDEIARTEQLGNMQSRKNATLDMLLSDWVRFEGFDTLKPGTQADGNPRIAGTENEVYRADSNLRTRETMTFNIAAEIADIRPNGLLVLSARKQVKNVDNTWELSLSGICRPQDVAADNTVLSRDIFELEIDKNEMGHVREAYSRGWLSKLYGKIKPF